MEKIELLRFHIPQDYVAAKFCCPIEASNAEKNLFFSSGECLAIDKNLLMGDYVLTTIGKKEGFSGT
jgi:hypothetical protein